MEQKKGMCTITAGGAELPLFFNNYALGEIEKDLERGIPAILRGYDETGKSGIREVSIMIQHGFNEARRELKLAKKRLSYIEATRILDAFGFVNVSPVIFQAIAETITFNPNDEEQETESDEETDESKN